MYALVLALLHQNIKNISVLIHCSPKVILFSINADKDFIHIPGIAEWTAVLIDRTSLRWSELTTPIPNRFVGNNNSSLCQKVLNIAKAETKPVIEPDCMTDDPGRKTISVVI